MVILYFGRIDYFLGTECDEGEDVWAVDPYDGVAEYFDWGGFCVYIDGEFKCYKAKLSSTKIFIRGKYIVAQLVDGKVAVFKVS